MRFDQVLFFDPKFDLAVCLEIAQHLSPSATGNIRETLTNPSDNVGFSAPVSHRESQNHINEQPPPNAVNLFETRSSVLSDFLHPIWWNMAPPSFGAVKILLSSSAAASDLSINRIQHQLPF